MVAFVAPGTGRVGFVAGRKVGTAVVRNRAKRMMREAWREVPPALREEIDATWVARAAIREAKKQDLVAEMTELLQRGRVALT